MSFFQILKLASSDVTGIYFNTSHPLGQVFEAMMEKRQDQIPDEGFLMTRKKRRKNGVSKGPNTETVCADIPCIAVKNTKVVYNKWK